MLYQFIWTDDEHQKVKDSELKDSFIWPSRLIIKRQSVKALSVVFSDSKAFKSDLMLADWTPDWTSSSQEAQTGQGNIL